MFKVVSGNIGSSGSNQWNQLEAEFEFGDLSNLSELSIYLGGTPTDSSFSVDEVTSPTLLFLGLSCVLARLEGGSELEDRGTQEK